MKTVFNITSLSVSFFPRIQAKSFLKYLRSLYSELANIVDYVNKMALSYPNVKFVLENDSKVLLNTDGSGNLLKVINSMYGFSVTKNLRTYPE